MSLPLLSESDWLARLRAARERVGTAGLAFYSSYLGGITTDPALMVMPVDDHLVHRGDGVFETLKCAGGGIYQLGPHLERLFRSAEAIGLTPPADRNGVKAAVLATVRAGGHRDCLVRVLLSRGPGGFGVDPAESRESGLVVVTYPAQKAFMERNPGGARAGISAIPCKPSFLAVIKTCNYLPNALMKAEANRRGLHFAVSLDTDGSLTESYTENLFILTQDLRLVVPQDTQMLSGTTLQRVLELARPFVDAGRLKGIESARLRPEEVWGAREVLIAGTTAHLTAVVEFEGRAIGDGRPGSWHAILAPLLDSDIAGNADHRTPVFEPSP